MKFKVLVSAPYIQGEIHRFEPLLRQHDIEILVPHVEERLNEEQLSHFIEEIDGAICGDDAFSEKTLLRATKLRVISKWGTGIDSIDVNAAARRGIKVFNTPDAFSHPVADSVIGYILCFARNLVAMNEEMRATGWKKVQSLSLSESTLGVIGVGNVGKQVVRRARAFGMRVLGNDLNVIENAFVKETGMVRADKEEIYEQSDFISTNCDLNPTSYHLLGDAQFALMKKSPVVINTARGSIIDENALVRALEGKRISGAALDVFEVEPLPRNSPLLRMKNVMMAPHNSNSSRKAWEFVHWNTVNNLLRGLGINVEDVRIGA